MNNIIVIAGPTASGKTKVSIELAKAINGELISADSMQVYKYMDIGTAKPTIIERQGIQHYLIDEVYPNEEFSVAKYQSLAINYIKEIFYKGKIPIIAGGTGLYINSLIYNIRFSEIETDWDLRKDLLNIANEKGNEYLHNQLREFDPEAAERIHVNDVKRIIRAIEVFRATNKTMTYHQRISRSEPSPYNYLLFGLTMDRQVLYDKINKRVDLMIEKGLINEVKNLMNMGYDQSHVSMQGLGYKEILWYLKGEASLDEAVYLLKRDTRHYAKRQMTWLRKIKEIVWININEETRDKDIIQHIINFI
ncbi:MAG TPA: tRNA (adenosine(37)-N6)-dimethylallyltransferase MiaA [Clostridiales bacterium]|nr:tRNA (adenosine(37)-N6)-dimethylallyltransferase MiaA [Clostridiales bacterium]